MSIAGALFVVFLVLKLAHVTGWSWWIVTLPLWGGAVLAVLLAAVAAALGFSALSVVRRLEK